MDRKIVNLMEDALKNEDYKEKINFLMAGLMFDDPEMSREQEKKRMDMLREMMEFCKKGNTEKHRNEYLKRTARRIEECISQE